MRQANNENKPPNRFEKAHNSVAQYKRKHQVGQARFISGSLIFDMF
jgi:hypothetical protein